MIVNAVCLTEGKHYMLRVNNVKKLKKVQEIVESCQTLNGVVDVYKYPSENEVRVLLRGSEGTAFARMIMKLADLEGVR